MANLQENTHAEVIEITLRDGRSPVNLLNSFRTPFYKNTSGWLLVLVVTKPKLFLLLSPIHICGFFKQEATSRLHTHLRINCIFRIVLLAFAFKKFSVRTYVMFWLHKEIKTTSRQITMRLRLSLLEEIEDTKKKKINSSAFNKMNCERKFLVIIYHFILCMRESIEQNIELEWNSSMLAQ